MTDTTRLLEMIKNSGYRMNYIAGKLGISYQGLVNKIWNKYEFKASEIQALCDLLHITNTDRQRIFFATFVYSCK